MDALEYFKYSEKICSDNAVCEGCPAGIFVSKADEYNCMFDSFRSGFDPEMAVKIVEQYKADNNNEQ